MRFLPVIFIDWNIIYVKITKNDECYGKYPLPYDKRHHNIWGSVGREYSKQHKPITRNFCHLFSVESFKYINEKVKIRKCDQFHNSKKDHKTKDKANTWT
jgi:hypothetical protein